MDTSYISYTDSNYINKGGIIFTNMYSEDYDVVLGYFKFL